MKDSLMPRFSKIVYNGFWFSPENEILLDFAIKTQENVSGTVRLNLFRGNCFVTGRKSPLSLYSENLVTMESDMGEYDPRDADGFIRLNALPFVTNKKNKLSN